MELTVSQGFEWFSYGFFAAIGLAAPLFMIRFMGNMRVDVQDTVNHHD